MKLRASLAAVAVAAGVGGGLTACSSGGAGYVQAYVVGETYCPGIPLATCAVLSDGDIVGPLQPSWGAVLAGMVLSPYGNSWQFTRQPASQHVSYTRITTVTSASTYADRAPVSPATEVSQQKSGTTYTAGGPRYPHSPAFKTAQARLRASKVAAQAAQKAAKQAQVRQPRTTYKAPAYSAPRKYGK